MGYTHDWEVWVRSPNAEDRIDSFLEKVVYTLHETFDDPVRRVCKPPFVVAEQGYGSFQIQIDLYFKAPKGSNLGKTRVVYELILQPSPPDGPADPDYKKEYSLRRLEKMQFPTKDEDFKRRLLKGGVKRRRRREGTERERRRRRIEEIVINIETGRKKNRERKKGKG